MKMLPVNHNCCFGVTVTVYLYSVSIHSHKRIFNINIKKTRIKTDANITIRFVCKPQPKSSTNW